MTATYPSVPGFKARETSAAAADAMAPRAKTLCDMALDVIASRANATADEVAAALGKSILAIRPRLSEIAVLGLIVDSGVRRENASGKRAIAWRIAERQMTLF